MFIKGYFFSLSASVHFQHSAELIRLLSGSNLNYTLQVTAAISPFLSNKLRLRCVVSVNKCVLELHRQTPVESFMTLTPHPFGVRVRVIIIYSSKQSELAANYQKVTNVQSETKVDIIVPISHTFFVVKLWHPVLSKVNTFEILNESPVFFLARFSQMKDTISPPPTVNTSC